MTDQPIDPRFKSVMQSLAHELDERFNGPRLPGIPRAAKNGFVLLAFEFGEPETGLVNYISNAHRADMLAAMKAFIARAEGRMIDTPSEARQ